MRALPVVALIGCGSGSAPLPSSPVETEGADDTGTSSTDDDTGQPETDPGLEDIELADADVRIVMPRDAGEAVSMPASGDASALVLLSPLGPDGDGAIYLLDELRAELEAEADATAVIRGDGPRSFESSRVLRTAEGLLVVDAIQDDGRALFGFRGTISGELDLDDAARRLDLSPGTWGGLSWWGGGAVVGEVDGSGMDGTVRMFRDGEEAGRLWGGVEREELGLGARVEASFELDGDGIPDLVIEAPGQDTWSDPPGQVHIVSGADLPETTLVDDLSVVVRGASDGDHLGGAWASGIDANGDGTDDLVLGATGAQRVYIITEPDDGLATDLAWQELEPEAWYPGDVGFGEALAAVPGPDGPRLAIGVPGAPAEGAPDVGLVLWVDLPGDGGHHAVGELDGTRYQGERQGDRAGRSLHAWTDEDTPMLAIGGFYDSNAYVEAEPNPDAPVFVVW